MVSDIAEFSVRGDIIDVFSLIKRLSELNYGGMRLLTSDTSTTKPRNQLKRLRK